MSKSRNCHIWWCIDACAHWNGQKSLQSQALGGWHEGQIAKFPFVKITETTDSFTGLIFVFEVFRGWGESSIKFGMKASRLRTWLTGNPSYRECNQDPVADPGFPSRGGRQLPRWGRKPINWRNLFRKLHENERIWTQRGRASLAPPLDSPLRSDNSSVSEMYLILNNQDLHTCCSYQQVWLALSSSWRSWNRILAA